MGHVQRNHAWQVLSDMSSAERVSKVAPPFQKPDATVTVTEAAAKASIRSGAQKPKTNETYRAASCRNTAMSTSKSFSMVRESLPALCSCNKTIVNTTVCDIGRYTLHMTFSRLSNKVRGSFPSIRFCNKPLRHASFYGRATSNVSRHGLLFG